jgi:hypothetical protein
MKLTVLIPLLCLFCFAAAAQTTQQNVYWVRLYMQYALTSKLELHVEVDERRRLDNNNHVQFISHNHLRWLINSKAAIAGGVSYSYVNGLKEIRPFQEFHYRMPIHKKVEIGHRFRTEQRWLQNADKTDYRFRSRWRYRLHCNYKPNEKWVFKVIDEVMTHTDAFDQNRIYGGVEHKFNPHISLEMGYMRLFQKRNETAKLKSNIFRATVLLKFF